MTDTSNDITITSVSSNTDSATKPCCATERNLRTKAHHDARLLLVINGQMFQELITPETQTDHLLWLQLLLLLLRQNAKQYATYSQCIDSSFSLFPFLLAVPALLGEILVSSTQSLLRMLRGRFGSTTLSSTTSFSSCFKFTSLLQRIPSHIVFFSFASWASTLSSSLRFSGTSHSLACLSLAPPAPLAPSSSPLSLLTPLTHQLPGPVSCLIPFLFICKFTNLNTLRIVSCVTQHLVHGKNTPSNSWVTTSFYQRNCERFHCRTKLTDFATVCDTRPRRSPGRFSVQTVKLHENLR